MSRMHHPRLLPTKLPRCCLCCIIIYEAIELQTTHCQFIFHFFDDCLSWCEISKILLTNYWPSIAQWVKCVLVSKWTRNFSGNNFTILMSSGTVLVVREKLLGSTVKDEISIHYLLRILTVHVEMSVVFYTSHKAASRTHLEFITDGICQVT